MISIMEKNESMSPWYIAIERMRTDEYSKINQVEMCLKCHQDGKLEHKNYKGEEELISNYKESYHYTALEEGNEDAAT